MFFSRHEMILAALETPRLIELARVLQIPEPAQRQRGQLIDLLCTARYDQFRGFLERLSVLELREICEFVGLREAYGDPADLIDRLLFIERRSPAPPPAPAAPGAPAPPAAGAPPAPPKRRGAKTQARGELGFEATLWQAADRLRSNMDAAEYKHVVLGLLFLKFVGEAGPPLRAAGAKPPPTRGFKVPAAARWDTLLGKARSPLLGRDLDQAMAAIEAQNPTLRGILPQIYQRPGLEAARLGELLHLLDDIPDLGSQGRKAHDVLGRVYEYFLTCFASAEGRNGGQFYTPPSVVGLLVALLAPTRGTIYDPACGSGGMFVQSERYFEEHGGHRGELKIVGQESNPTTWRLARMNLAIRGIEGDLGAEPSDSFMRDLHADLRADYILANPPFNARAWGATALAEDPRFCFGLPPDANANFAWVQHILYHLAPQGLAGLVLANGSLTVGGREGEIRRRIVEADLVDGIIALPARLFYSTAIPVCLWLLARDKASGRDRRGKVLMIDARDMGAMLDRTHLALRPEELAEIAGIYHAWRGAPVSEGMSQKPYVDVPGRCCAVDLPTLAEHEFILAPTRHVRPAEAANAAPDFAEQFAALRRDLLDQIDRAAALDREIADALARVEVP
ncbi:N-6 DNA methylase [Nannocystis pusilla]|uniref:type I restriction-modification system subunit M n=1 Tax=Nannocystis pusilla TaxID=889268 RepID=UPI003BEFD0A1